MKINNTGFLGENSHVFNPPGEGKNIRHYELETDKNARMKIEGRTRQL